MNTPLRYLAVLNGPHISQVALAKCFDSDLCRVTYLGHQWILESSLFNACSSPQDVFPLADKALSDIRRILWLYSGLSQNVTVEYIQCVDADGQLCGSAIRGNITPFVCSPNAIPELARLTHAGQRVGSAIFEAATKDPKIATALQLYREFENRWSDVYDIIEFLGGTDQIARVGWATRSNTSQVRQTANYYRHLGTAKDYRLPKDPPTLGEASLFAKQLLKKWIAKRLDLLDQNPAPRGTQRVSLRD